MYTKTNWIDGKTYGADAFNNIESGIESLDVRRQQIQNMANGLWKLRRGQNTNIAMFGDSVFYAYDQTSEDKVQEDCVDDYGERLTGYYRCPVTIYDTFMECMNKVYQDKITLTKKIFTGCCAKWALTRWKVSGSDFAIMNYGINDAMGGHIPSDYRGNIPEFIKCYRELIEREIKNGTAVILLTPIRQVMVADYDTDSRTAIDVYEQTIKDLAKEYGCPCIDGNESNKNFGNDLFIDFTHFTKDGFRAIGYRLASIFVGQSAMYPLAVGDGTFIGCNTQVHNVNIVPPAKFATSEVAPTIPTLALNKGDFDNPSTNNLGLEALIEGDGKVYWSFYCPYDGMVVVPSLYTASQDVQVTMKLDFGAIQGRWSNYWTAKGETLDREYREANTITLENADFVGHKGKSYGLHCLRFDDQPVIKITTSGWHTIEISATFTGETGTVSVFGLNFLSLDSYNQKICKKIPLTLKGSTAPYDQSRTPYLYVNGGEARLMGFIKDFTQSNTEASLTFPVEYAPKQSSVYTVALSSSTNGGYGTVQVTGGGNIMICYAGTSTNCQLNGIAWKIGG